MFWCIPAFHACDSTTWCSGQLCLLVFCFFFWVEANHQGGHDFCWCHCWSGAGISITIIIDAIGATPTDPGSLMYSRVSSYVYNNPGSLMYSGVSSWLITAITLLHPFLFDFLSFALPAFVFCVAYIHLMIILIFSCLSFLWLAFFCFILAPFC